MRRCISLLRRAARLAIVFSGVSVATRLAIAATIIADIEVIARQRMTVLAFCLVLPPTPLRIFPGRYRFQMFRVYAPTIAAKMVDDQALWNWAFELHISEPMRRYCRTGAIRSAPYPPMAAIAVPVERTHPFPASIASLCDVI
jgi:hypothetical protein